MDGEALVTTVGDGLHAAWGSWSGAVFIGSGKPTACSGLWEAHGGAVHPDGCEW